MAKKKETAPALSEIEDLTQKLSDEVEKDFGKGLLIDGDACLDEEKQVIPMSPALDVITSGGIEEGSWVSITGNPKTSKTSLALAFAANCQRPEYGARPVYFADVEGRLTKNNHLYVCQGLKTQRPFFFRLRSSKGTILTAQQFLDILTRALKIPGSVVVIDSISALCDEKEISGGVETETRGGGAKLFSRWVRQNANVVPTNNNIVIGIVHLISNTSGMGAQYVEKSARGWQYQADYQLRTLSRSEWPKGSGDKALGLEIQWICNTSKLGPPGMKGLSYLRFGMGIDRLSESINLALGASLIKKAASWYTLDYMRKYMDVFDESAVKTQGVEGIYQMLKEHPEWGEALNKELAALAGGKRNEN